MTLAKVEGIVVEHAVALGRLEERSDNLKKEVSDLNSRLVASSIAAKEFEASVAGLTTRVGLNENEAAGFITAKEPEAAIAGLTTRVALIEKEIADLKLTNDRGRTTRVSLLAALFSASLSLIVSIIIAVSFRSKP